MKHEQARQTLEQAKQQGESAAQSLMILKAVHEQYIADFEVWDKTEGPIECEEIVT